MVRYVLGFAFDSWGRMALIKKERPDWQKGKFNGIGGHLEDTDHSLAHAMEREFREETGVTIPHDQWRQVAFMHREGVWECTVFTTRHADVEKVRTMTDEDVRLVTCRWFELNKEHAMENVALLIQASLLQPGHSGQLPAITLTYPA